MLDDLKVEFFVCKDIFYFAVTCSRHYYKLILLKFSNILKGIVSVNHFLYRKVLSIIGWECLIKCNK